MGLDDRQIASIVEGVVQTLQADGALSREAAEKVAFSSGFRFPTPVVSGGGGAFRNVQLPPLAPEPGKRPLNPGRKGLFPDVDSAVAAAERAFYVWRDTPIVVRARVVEAMRRVILDNLESIAKRAVEETTFGRVADKIEKNRLAATKTPGPEILTPRVITGDYGMTLIERAAYGVIASITPCTNPSETICNNSISMISGGNSVVFNVHPTAKKISAWTIENFYDAIIGAGGPPNLVCAIMPPTIDSAQALMHHPKVRVVGVTGGGEVVKVALSSGKRAVAAGPGNPPCLVDETADLDKAARCFVKGASFDNTVICVTEKKMLCVESVADALKQGLRHYGAYEVSGSKLEALERVVLTPDKHVNRKWIGKDAKLMLREIGVHVDDNVRLIFAEVKEDHPFVQLEMLLPVVGFVRVPDVGAGIEAAFRIEHGNRHTAGMYSRNVEALSAMARRMDCSIFVKNAPHYSGLGFGGEGYTAWTIASPTGDGCTTAMTWTRERRCTLAEYFHIV